MFLIIDFGSKKTPMIAEVLGRLGYKGKIVGWNENVLLGSDVSGIILSGAPVLLTKVEQKPYIERFAFLKETQLPILGICFGHQLIGLLHGSEVYLGEENRTNVRIQHNDTLLFEGLSNPCEMIADHTEGISLPKGFVHLASSKDYELEAMQHTTKKIFGVQFHPEVSGESGRILLNNFCKTL